MIHDLALSAAQSCMAGSSPPQRSSLIHLQSSIITLVLYCRTLRYTHFNASIPSRPRFNQLFFSFIFSSCLIPALNDRMLSCLATRVISSYGSPVPVTWQEQMVVQVKGRYLRRTQLTDQLWYPSCWCQPCQESLREGCKMRCVLRGFDWNHSVGATLMQRAWFLRDTEGRRRENDSNSNSNIKQASKQTK
jgi:hypothetical protein